MRVDDDQGLIENNLHQTIQDIAEKLRIECWKSLIQIKNKKKTFWSTQYFDIFEFIFIMNNDAHSDIFLYLFYYIFIYKNLWNHNYFTEIL